jgi:hypothetical protein
MSVPECGSTSALVSMGWASGNFGGLRCDRARLRCSKCGGRGHSAGRPGCAELRQHERQRVQRRRSASVRVQLSLAPRSPRCAAGAACASTEIYGQAIRQPKSRRPNVPCRTDRRSTGADVCLCTEKHMNTFTKLTSLMALALTGVATQAETVCQNCEYIYDQGSYLGAFWPGDRATFGNRNIVVNLTARLGPGMGQSRQFDGEARMMLRPAGSRPCAQPVRVLQRAGDASGAVANSNFTHPEA